MADLCGCSTRIGRLETAVARLEQRPDCTSANSLLNERQELRARCGQLEEALRFYADEDSEPDAGGVDGGKTALVALGLIQEMGSSDFEDVSQVCAGGAHRVCMLPGCECECHD